MTEFSATPPTPGADHQPDPESAEVRQARVAALAAARKGRRRHPAQGSRIAAAGLGATAMLGLVGIMGYSGHRASPSSPVATPKVVVVVHHVGAPDSTPGTSAHPPVAAPASTKLTARPTVRSASPRSKAPAASTSGSR